MKNKIYIVLLVIFVAALVVTTLFIPGDAVSESDDYLDGLKTEDLQMLYVTANQLNGRASPSKAGLPEMLYDNGDILYATGRWSSDHMWVEVLGGENPTVWVNIKYVTGRKDAFAVTPQYYGKFKIRNKPVDGRVVGYVRDDQTIQINQVVLGWGKCKKGWVDLDNFIEVEE